MRGKVLFGGFFGRFARITPAHAGKRYIDRHSRAAALDHPRPCGEKIDDEKVLRRPSGSPPPMRGKGAGSGVRSSRTRITPAHAGKSRWYCPTFDGGGDHPRPCGEKQLRTEYDGLPSGSPPPMRGKGIQESGLRHGFRITPAHAGKSCSISA